MGLSEQEARDAVGLVGKIPVPPFFRPMKKTAAEVGQQGVTNVVAANTRTERELAKIFDTPPSKSNAESESSPIIIDLDGNGVGTIALQNSNTFFDLDSNHFSENTGWVGKNDALLSLDLNSDGIINNGKELFGNHTKLENGESAKNGYEALKQYDENKDGKIDIQDSIWNKLLLWKDSDSDAKSEEGELITLDEAGIKSISLNYINSSEVDEKGNAHKQQSTIEWVNGDQTKSADVNRTGFVGDFFI